METISDNEVILDFREARAYLRCSRQKLYSLMASGALKGYKVGNTRVFYKKDLKQLIQESPPPPSMCKMTAGEECDQSAET